MTKRHKQSERTRYEDVAAAKMVLEAPTRFHPDVVLAAKRTLGRCTEKGCAWPAWQDDLCRHCWQRVFGDCRDIPRKVNLVAGDRVPRLRWGSYSAPAKKARNPQVAIL